MEPQKALFYVRQTVANGWSRSVLHHFIDSSLYERQGKALSNFRAPLPYVDSDLAQELTIAPYIFAFAGITKPYNHEARGALAWGVVEATVVNDRPTDSGSGRS